MVPSIGLELCITQRKKESAWKSHAGKTKMLQKFRCSVALE